jgi:hypothetical protein
METPVSLLRVTFPTYANSLIYPEQDVTLFHRAFLRQNDAPSSAIIESGKTLANLFDFYALEQNKVVQNQKKSVKYGESSIWRVFFTQNRPY